MILSRCGPLSLLIASFVVIGGGLTIPTLSAGLLASSALAAALVIGAWGAGFSLVRLIPAVIALVSLVWSNWLLADPRSLPSASLAALRVGYFIVPGLVLSAFIDPFTLGDHLGQRLRMPARPVLAIVAALQRLESLSEDWETISRSRRARGVGAGRGMASRVRHVSGTTMALLVEAIRSAGRLTVAMEARGYSSATTTGVRRSWAHAASWTPYDTGLSVVAGLFAIFPTVLDHWL